MRCSRLILPLVAAISAAAVPTAVAQSPVADQYAPAAPAVVRPAANGATPAVVAGGPVDNAVTPRAAGSSRPRAKRQANADANANAAVGVSAVRPTDDARLPWSAGVWIAAAIGFAAVALATAGVMLRRRRNGPALS